MGFALHIAFWLIVGLAVAAGALYGGWAALGRPHIDSDTDKIATDVLLDLVRISLTVVAGVGGIVALVVAYRKQRLGEAQHHREEAGSRREDQKMYSERFSKASELLGSERSAIRLAAVYSIGRLADDWEAGRQMCIDVLCAYLRMPHKPLNKPPIDQILDKEYRRFERQPWRAALLETSPLNASEEHQVRATIIRVIVEHLDPEAAAPWFGHSFNFTGAVLDAPNFTDAHFRDCYVDFYDSFLYGEIEFSGAHFVNSEINFTSAIIGGQCSFEVCEFDGANIHLTADVISGGGIKFYYSRMKDTVVEIYGLELDGGDFTFMEILMENSKLTLGTAQIKNSSVALSRTHVENSRITIRDATFTNSSLFLSGMRINNNGQVVFSTQTDQNGLNSDLGPVLTDTNLYLNDVGIHGGFLGFRKQHFVRTPMHWQLLAIDGGEIVMSQSQLDDSPVTFDKSSQKNNGRAVFDFCSEQTEPLDSTGLIPQSEDDQLVVNIRRGVVKDIEPSTWTKPRTLLKRESDSEVRPRPRPWY